MSKDTTQPHDLPLTNAGDLPDPLGTLMATPMRKLDADEYTANDLDGVTESATGSGNLNFLMMQAGQTNEAISTLDPFSGNGGDRLGLTSFGSAGGISPFDNDGNISAFASGRGGNNYDMAGDLGSTYASGNESQVAYTSGSTAASPSYTAFQTPAGSNGASVPSTSGTNGVDGLGGLNGTNGGSGVDGTDSTNGGGDGTIVIINNNNNTVIVDNTVHHGDTTINVIDNTVLTTIENIYISTTTNIFDTINNTTNNLVEIIDGTTTNIFDTVNHITTNVFNLVENLTTNVFDTVTNLFDTVNHITTNLTEILTSTTTNVTNIINNITDILDGLLPGGGGGNGDTDLALGGLGGLLDASVVNGVVEVVLNPVEDLLGDLDLGGSLGLGLLGLGSGQTGPDTDVTIPLNLGILDNGILSNSLEITLDPLENILGDIDLDLGIAANLLGNVASPIFDSLAGGTGEETILPNVGDVLGGLVGDVLPFGDGNGDTDLSLDLGIGAFDQHLVGNALDLALNPVEDLVGDLDIGAGIGLGLLGTADNSANDTDLSLSLDLGIVDIPLLTEGIHIPLDPLEALVGDIDLDLGIAANLLGDVAGGIFDSAEGGSGSGLLADVGDALGDLVTGDLDGAITGLLDGLIGALDSTVNNAVSLVDSIVPNAGGLDLGALTGGLTGGAGGGLLSGITGWTETILPNAGDILGGGLAVDPVCALPDPILSSPVISLPPIPVLSSIPVLGGGLFSGNGGGGGLFG